MPRPKVELPTYQGLGKITEEEKIDVEGAESMEVR